MSGLGKTENTWGYIIELKLTLRKLSDNDVVYNIILSIIIEILCKNGYWKKFCYGISKGSFSQREIKILFDVKFVVQALHKMILLIHKFQIIQLFYVYDFSIYRVSNTINTYNKDNI